MVYREGFSSSPSHPHPLRSETAIEAAAAGVYNTDMEEYVLAVDPGKGKIGLALLDGKGNLVRLYITTPAEFPTCLQEWRKKYNFRHAAVGNSTGKDLVLRTIRSCFLPYQLIDERNSTQEARLLFFEHHPPRGWRRLFPRSLQYPSQPFDDFQAAVIGRRYLQSRRKAGDSR